jgi:KRAB domain-containing zinc finger protein
MLGCAKEFATLSNLFNHRSVHTSEKLFKCVFLQCKKSYTSKSKLQKHSFSHTKEKPFRCPYSDCSKKFGLGQSMIRHIRTKHTHPDLKPFAYNHCTKNFKTNTNLIFHKKTHDSDKKKLECVQCSAKYFDKRNLKIHIKDKHSKEKQTKDYKCQDCHKMFANSDYLNLHIKYMHKPKIMKICYFCRSTFKTNWNLYQHLKIHTKEKPFKCIRCKKKFANSTNIKAHMVRKLIIRALKNFNSYNLLNRKLTWFYQIEKSSYVKYVQRNFLAKTL